MLKLLSSKFTNFYLQHFHRSALLKINLSLKLLSEHKREKLSILWGCFILLDYISLERISKGGCQD